VYPTIHIGSIQIGTYAVALGAAILLTAGVSFYRLIRGGFSVRHVTNGGLLTIWGGFIGAFLFKAIVVGIQNLLLTGELSIAGGSAFMGALAGGLVTAVWYIRRHRLNMGRALDLGLLPIPLGQAIGRLGCFAAGCCYGLPTDSPLGMVIRNHSGEWAVRYPTQLMSAAADLLIFYALLAFERVQTRKGRQGWPFDGFIVLSYIALYSFKRFAIEFLRAETPPPLLGPFNITHFLGAAGFLSCIGLIAWNLRRRAANV
jgi:phosphatidylglycerol:prolipoprotein diacylglycerol transferase